MKTLLVTGGSGFIGSNFIIHMLKHHPEDRIINLDKLTYAGNPANLAEVENHPGYTFVHGDICDKDLVESIFQTNTLQYVVNFAAESHVDRSIHDPDVFVRTNVLGTANLLSLAKRFWLDTEGYLEDQYEGGFKFIQVSTDEVYGSLGREGYFTEATPLDPHSPYSASKAGADVLVKAYFDTFQMPVNITRCSNNYGPYQFPEKLIPLMIHNALGKRSLPVYGDGLNIRDWLYVEDHCRAIDLVLHLGKSGEVYNIGGHNEKTNIEIVETILDYLSETVDGTIDRRLIQFVDDRKGHDRRYGIDPEKIGRELGWGPQTYFKEGIRKTIQWYLDHPDWVEDVTSGDYLQYYSQMYEKGKSL